MAKSKLTPEAQKKICDLVERGNYAKTAALASGITEATFYNWMARGKEAKRGIYFEFFESIKRAEAESEKKYLSVIQDAADSGTWQAAAWYLERRNHKEWGRKTQTEVTGKDGAPILIVKWNDDAQPDSD